MVTYIGAFNLLLHLLTCDNLNFPSASSQRKLDLQEGQMKDLDSRRTEDIPCHSFSIVFISRISCNTVWKINSLNDTESVW